MTSLTSVKSLIDTLIKDVKKLKMRDKIFSCSTILFKLIAEHHNDACLVIGVTKVVKILRIELCTFTIEKDCEISDVYMALALIEIIIPNVHPSSLPRVLKEYIISYYSHSTSFVDINMELEHSEQQMIANTNTITFIGRLRSSINLLLENISRDNSELIQSLSSFENLSLINYCDSFGWKLIHYAAYYESCSSLKVLRSLGLGVNEVTKSADKATPLHIACQHMRLHGIRYLVSIGASLTQRNAKGFTPLQMFLRAWAHNITSMITQKPQEMIDLLHILISGPNDILDSEPYSNLISTTSEDGNNQTTFINFWSFESYSPFFIGACYLEASIFDELASIASIAPTKSLFRGEIAKTLMYSIYKRRIGGSLIILNRFSSLLFQEWDRAVELMTDLICVSIENGMMEVVAKLLELIHMHSNLEEVCFNPMPLFEALVFNDALILNMLLNHGFAHSILIPLTSMTNPRWRNVASFQYFCPLNIACLRNDATSVSKMIEKLPGSILSATHCLKSDTVSPLVCAMLVSSVACIETLKRFMRPREYSLACRVPDSCGFRPLSLLLSHIRISTSEQMSREYQYSESTVRCVYLIIQEMKNISFVRDQRYENNLTLWKQRSSWVRRRLSEAIDGQRSCKERIIATSSTMDFTQLRQEVVQLNERQERVKKYIDDKIFQIDLKLFQASIYNRNTGFLIHSFLIVFSKTIFTPNKNMEEDFLKFCNMSKAYDSFLIRVKNIEGIAKVLGPKAWHNAKHQFENIGAVRQNVNASNYRSCRFYDFLFQWVKLVLDYSALIFGYNLENTESADDEASMSERNTVIEAIKSEKFRNQEIFVRKVLLYMPKFSSSTNSDYYCLSELVGSDKVEHSCSVFINGAFNLIKEMKWRGLWDAAGVQADDVPVVHKNSLKDTIATMIIQELKIGESETLLDGMGQSLTQALAINSCWDAALALISNIQSQRGHLRTHFEMCIYLHSTAISYLDKARYSRKYRTFPNNLDLLHPESWTDEDIWKEINMDSLRFHSIVDIALENRQNSFLRKYLNGCSKFVHDCSSTYLEKLASSIDAYDTCSIICTDLGDMTGCEAPVLMRRQGRSVDTLSTNYKSLRVPNHPETFNRCTAHQLDIPNHKIELARGLRSLLYDCHRVSHLLLNTEDIPINDEDVSTSLVDLVRPQMEGTLAGLCLNHDESSVLLQDGTYVPLETFLESKSLLLMSMPAPVMRGGPYCTGYNILHAACSHNEEGLALVMGILTVSTELTPKSCFMTDLLGKTPIYYALEQKNLKVAKFLLDYIKKGDISRPSEELSHVSNVLESSKKYPPKSVNVGGMYLPRAMRWLSYAQSRYRTVEAANQWESSMISNSSNGDYNNGGVIWPTVRDAMLLSSLKVLGRLWSKISDTSFVPHFHNLYITTFNVLGSVNCAKRILKALNFTPGRLQECAKLLSNPLPCHVQKLLPMETYLHVKDALQKWILQLNSDGQPRNATHCKIINTLVLYQLCSRKLQDLIELEREYDKNYQNFDLCHSICSGRGLPSLVMTDLRSYCTGEVSHSNLGGVGSSSLKTRLEEFLNIYRKDRLLVQETMNSAMTIIEFGRSLIMSRCLSVASNPPKSIDPSPYAGDECMDIRDFQHPLDHILNDLHRARECERNAMNLLNAMDNSAEMTVFQNMQSESNDPIALIERTQNKGAVTRISALDNVNIEMLDLLLLSKSEIGYRSESKKHIFKAIGLIYATFSDSRDIQSWFSLCQNDTKSDTYILSKSAVDIQREVDTKTSTKVHDRQHFLSRLQQVTIVDILNISEPDYEAIKDTASGIDSSLGKSLIPSLNDDILKSLIEEYRDEIVESLEQENVANNNVESDINNKYKVTLPTDTTMKRVKTNFLHLNNTLNNLSSFIHNVAGIRSHRALYTMDVNMNLQNNLLNPLCLLPNLMTNENAQEVHEVSQMLLDLGFNPLTVDGNGRRAFTIACISGKSDIVYNFVNNRRQILTSIMRNGQDKMMKHLVWYVLMACPPPSSNRSDSNERRDYEECIILMLNQGWKTEITFKGNLFEFDTAPPDECEISCSTLAAMKELPRALKLILLLERSKEIITDKSKVESAVALHYVMLSPLLRDDSSLVYDLTTQYLQTRRSHSIQRIWLADSFECDIAFYVETISNLVVDNAFRQNAKNNFIDTLKYHKLMMYRTYNNRNIRRDKSCALHSALQECISLLSDEHVNKIDGIEPITNDWSPLHFAMAVHDDRIVTLMLTRLRSHLVDGDTSLLSFGAFYDYPSVLDITLYDAAASSAVPSLIDIAINNGSSAASKELLLKKWTKCQKVTSLHLIQACRYGYSEIIQELLKHMERSDVSNDIKLKDVNHNGEGLMHLITMNVFSEKAIDILQMLTSLGMNSRQLNSKGMTALEVSITLGNKYATKYLGKLNASWRRAALIIAVAYRKHLFSRYSGHLNLDVSIGDLESK